MKLEVFAIKDRALNAYMQPFFAPTIGAAIRAFSDGMNDNTTPMAKHPDDYDLWHLSSWDDASGKFSHNNEYGGPDQNNIWPKQIAIGKNLRTE